MDEIVKILLLDSGEIEPGENFYPIDIAKKYLISPLGKVYSTKTYKIMKARINKPSPYHYIKLPCDDGVLRNLAIHRLVALAFVPNMDGKREVNHLDGNPTNNNFKNLKWVTGDENLAHAKNMGKFKKKKKK